MPSKEFQAFLQLVRATARERDAKATTIAGVREIIDSFANTFPVDSDVRVTPVTCNGVPCEWVEAPNAAPDRYVMYLHGGCYISGAPAVVREYAARLSRAAQARVLSVDYRLAPEHPFPAALEDARAVYHWLLDAGADPRRIVVNGESAGGGLTIALLLALRDAGTRLPAAGVPISPWVDMEVSFGASLVRNLGVDMATVAPLELGGQAYAGPQNLRHPLASPLYADLAGLPPLLIQVGLAEVLLDEGVEFARRATAAGVDVTLEQWPDMIHVWHWYGSMFPEARDAIAGIGAYVIERTGFES